MEDTVITFARRVAECCETMGEDAMKQCIRAVASTPPGQLDVDALAQVMPDDYKDDIQLVRSTLIIIGLASLPNQKEGAGAASAE